MWKRISTVCLVIISIVLTDSSICAGREWRRKALQPAFHTNVPYLAPELDVKPVIPKWPKRLVEMYDTISIIFIGDVMQHGYQIRSAHIKGMDREKPESYNYSHAFKYLKTRFSEADLTVANMEFPVGVPPFTGYPRFSAPESIVTEAIESGIDLFQIANNHILDKGMKGLERTLSIYDSLGVHYTGAYRCDSLEKLHNPKIIEIDKARIAFINFTYGTNGFKVPEPYVINYMDSTSVKLAIGRAKERRADIIIALPHWGNEYQTNPSKEQKKWAEMLFKNGVDIIIGTHPHVPQSAELYRNKTLNPRRYGAIDKMVFYSLGNYISNQSIPDYTQLGLLVKVNIIRNNLSEELSLGMPEYEYLWCFKKGEFESDYTVVPVEEFISNPHNREKMNDKSQYDRMEATYKFIMNKNLVKELYP